MKKRLAKLPSPAMAVAFVALLAALTGTAVALPGSNSVTGGDIRNGAVTTSDIRNSTVRGRDVRNNTLTGSDVNENGLGTVPRANAANSAGFATAAALAGSANNAGAVDGQSIAKINYNADANTPDQTILNFGGLVLSANCDADDLTVVANPSGGSANSIHAGLLEGFTAADYDEIDSGFAPGDDFDVLIGGGDSIQGTLTFQSPAGNVVTVTYAAEEDEAADCQFWGTAVGS
jgi:hypothetical protein